jgi:hypothetical protein
MQSIALSAAVILMLSGGIFSPVLTPADSKGTKELDASQKAVVWLDQGENFHGTIVKVDGKRSPSRKLAGYPYSVFLTKGNHKLFIRLLDHSGSDYSLTTWTYEKDFDVAVEPGRTYVIKFLYVKSAGGRNLHIDTELKDMGDAKNCSYEVSGPMNRGYTPVKLSCV